jgi:tetratricopeptide (TPR) repeat protein
MNLPGSGLLRSLGRRYYRQGLAAARRRDIRAALAYAEFARLLDPENADAARLGEICGYELGEGREPVLERAAILAGQKKWKAAALAARGADHQSVRLLTIAGCLWALAKRYGAAADCFAQALARDRGNALAAKALVDLGRRRRFIGGFFAPH